MDIACSSNFSQALTSQRWDGAMDVAVAGDSQQFEELALAAAKEKAGLVRKRIGDEAADVKLLESCRL